MADTDYGIDVLLIDGGLVIGISVPAIPPMQPPVRRSEQVAIPSAARVDE
jgi:hypothetical protein